MRDVHRIFVITAATLTLVGCGVSKQVVAEKDAAFEACRAEKETCQDQMQATQEEIKRLQEELATAKTRAQKSERELGRLSDQMEQGSRELTLTRDQLGTTQQDLESSQLEAKSLQQTETELRARLEQQMRECTVDIERLRSQLRVRVVEQVFFNTGSADIRPDGKPVLDQIAAALKEGGGQIRIEGHTDEMPIGQGLKSRWFSNWELSSARAASVVRYFQYAHGIDPRRMTVVGRSSFSPLVTNDSPENRRKNRRVEIILTQTQ